MNPQIKLDNTIMLLSDLIDNLHKKDREEIHSDLQVTLYMAKK